MAYPEADSCDVDEGEEDFGIVVIADGAAASVFQSVEAPPDEVP